MGLPTTDAPYSGGYHPGGRIFAVDGDFTVAAPHGPPELSYPIHGDSIPSVYPIATLTRDPSASPQGGIYSTIPVGSAGNIQGFNASQDTVIIEQEFMVAEAFYVPMPLNTTYNTAWIAGWGAQYVDLSTCFLIEECDLKPESGGLVTFKRRFVNLPANRNEYESFNHQFPGIDPGDGISLRFPISKVVNSRLFYEYFAMYDNNLLTGIPEFPNGNRLTTTNWAANASQLLIPETFFFAPENTSVTNNLLLPADGVVANADPADPTSIATVPGMSQYVSWIGTTEIVAEASTLSRWLGNILVRKTRFVLAL